MRDLTRNNSICPPPEQLLLEGVKKNDSDNIKILINSNRLLLEHKYPYAEKTILSIACSEDGIKPETVKLLIDLGADVSGNEEWKPLHLAAQNPNSTILETILENIQPEQINDTVEGNTALHSLIKSNTIKENEKGFTIHVQLLLNNGINVNQGDMKNLSAIFWAAKNGYKNIVKTILKESNCVDLDQHKLRNKCARDFINDLKLYDEPLPSRITTQIPLDKLFSLLKLGKEDEFIKYFDTLSLTNPSDFINMDDGTSTLLQYSCSKGLKKITKYLLERGVNVNKTTKNQIKKPLEIVTENGYYEILEMLLDHPDVELSSDTLCYFIKHSDSGRFDKMDHEKCRDLVLKKLETCKDCFNINETDDLKNTALHYSLRYADEATSHRLLKLGASLGSKNSFGVMPIEDIKPEMLENHLDECIQFNFKQKNDEKRDFEVIFDYTTLIPTSGKPRKDPENFPNTNEILSPEMEVVAYMSKAQEFRPLLKHPVVVALLFLKWYRIRLLFYINLIFYILFVGSLISYIFSDYVNFDKEVSDFCLGLSKFSFIILNVTFWLLLLREVFQMTVSPNKYFQSFENLVEIILIIITGMILYENSPSSDTRRQLASIVILLAAFELVLMVGQHPKLSTNVVMLKTVSINFFKLLLWYSLLIIAFALSFYILFAKTELPSNTNSTDSDNEDLFTGPGKSLFKTIVMLTGEFDAGSINFQTYPLTSKLIFSLFVFMITIILLNLLNGLAVSDTQTIKNNAELVGHIARAQHIYYVESMLLGNILPKTILTIISKVFCCFPCDRHTTYNILKPLARRICLFRNRNQCQLTVQPNNFGKIYLGIEKTSKRRQDSLSSCSQVCFDAYLDKQTVRRTLAIVKERRELDEAVSLENVEILCNEITLLKRKLDNIMKSLTQRRAP